MDEVKRQAGESQNPTCNLEHTCDTHWLPNFRTCLFLPMQTWVQAPATMAIWFWAKALQLHGWK